MTLSDKLVVSYGKQISGDGALDLFDPSVEVLLAPFYASVKPGLPPAEDFVVPKFKEYFTAGTGIQELIEHATEPGGLTNLPLALGSDCKRLLDTWSIPRPCLLVRGKRGTYKDKITF